LLEALITAVANNVRDIAFKSNANLWLGKFNIIIEPVQQNSSLTYYNRNDNQFISYC